MSYVGLTSSSQVVQRPLPKQIHKVILVSLAYTKTCWVQISDETSKYYRYSEPPKLSVLVGEAHSASQMKKQAQGLRLS